jgi:hypothetical protein
MQSGEAQDVEEVAKVIHVDFTANIVCTVVYIDRNELTSGSFNFYSYSCRTPHFPHTPMILSRNRDRVE